jgi:hypothetical protein
VTQQDNPILCVTLTAAFTIISLMSVYAASSPLDMIRPGCEAVDAKGCVVLAIEAMGGRAKLAGISTEMLDIIDDTKLTEQSPRQAPFITSYDRIALDLDFAKGRERAEIKSLWPESDPGTSAAESNATLIASISGAVIHTAQGDNPASLANIDGARATLELGPERLLLTAEAAPDLHFGPAENLRSTPHAVVAFQWNGAPVKVLINASNHLPDAVENVRPFNDFWFAWGDVSQRVYFDNWKMIGGIVYPTNRIDERNGILWRSAQILDAKFNDALDDKLFAMDTAAAEKSAQGKGWDRPFDTSKVVVLAPGVELYQGAWNVTIVRQDLSVLVLEAPISPSFTKAVLAQARTDNPGVSIMSVLSSSDSWPHVAGVRQAVAEKLPVYILDLNQPLLDRMIAAPHALRPDDLQNAPSLPQWHIVSAKTEIGAGANRVVLYPLRGAATERQYMVYFPERRLLYASDTLVVNDGKHTIYDPELMREVMQAVKREHLLVDRVYAMHQAPVAWGDVLKMMAAAEG